MDLLGNDWVFSSINYRGKVISHQNFRVVLQSPGRPSESSLYFDSVWTVVEGRAGNHISLRSKNYPAHYIRHSNFRCVLHEDGGDRLFEEDSTFKLRDGLTGGEGVSFESINYPNYFLRHSNFKLCLNENDGSDLFLKDATYLPGLVPPD